MQQDEHECARHFFIRVDTIVAYGTINPTNLEGIIMLALNTLYATQWAMYETAWLSCNVITLLTYEEICQFLTSLDKTMVSVHAKTGVQHTVQTVVVVPE